MKFQFLLVCMSLLPFVLPANAVPPPTGILGSLQDLVDNERATVGCSIPCGGKYKQKCGHICPYCAAAVDTSKGTVCSQCRGPGYDSDCPSGGICRSGEYSIEYGCYEPLPTPACYSTTDCPADRPICDKAGTYRAVCTGCTYSTQAEDCPKGQLCYYIVKGYSQCRVPNSNLLSANAVRLLGFKVL
ncbi:hypothetical protein B0H13DRAFT_537068 [Mycena leptocephala]|nr:hypothetical protein B0H13DRAFT_537068 [Mycena leptocephala]